MSDLRIKRTLYAIETALIELLQHNEFEQISVLMICEKAMINPKTFYKYHAGKSALAGQIIKDFKAKFAQLLHERLHTVDLPAFFEKVNQFFFTHRHTVLALWKIQSKRHHLWVDMQTMIERTFVAHAQNHLSVIDEKRLAFQSHLFAIMLLNSLKYQLEQGDILPMKTLFEQINEMMSLVGR
ncbi:TetR/AcrR family transcriptional regulator [Mannheimia indoligenes]|uniref:TetR/AcrR family transcriptional regulator n=1 Tax=Mannheimia indoligenes TaxID=3103145 RepID=UPI002FE5269F